MIEGEIIEFYDETLIDKRTVAFKRGDGIMTTYTCKRCGNTYPRTLEYFGKDKRRADGMTYPCKSCLRKAASDYQKRKFNDNHN